MNELTKVRELKKELEAAEVRLREMRIAAENIVPIIDGLPRATQAQSKVEHIALKIIEAEQEIANLRGEIASAKTELADKIMKVIDEPAQQAILMLRYVECLSFREIARRMNFVLRKIYKLHDESVKTIHSSTPPDTARHRPTPPDTASTSP